LNTESGLDAIREPILRGSSVAGSTSQTPFELVSIYDPLPASRASARARSPSRQRIHARTHSRSSGSGRLSRKACVAVDPPAEHSHSPGLNEHFAVRPAAARIRDAAPTRPGALVFARSAHRPAVLIGLSG
jgi:hypothetical protein